MTQLAEDDTIHHWSILSAKRTHTTSLNVKFLFVSVLWKENNLFYPFAGNLIYNLLLILPLLKLLLAVNCVARFGSQIDMWFFP